MGCADSRKFGDVRALCSSKREFAEPAHATSLAVAREFLMILHERRGASAEYIRKLLAASQPPSYASFTPEEQDAFFGDFIYSALTKTPTCHYYLTEMGLGKLFDEKHNAGQLKPNYIISNVIADPFFLRRRDDGLLKGTLFYSSPGEGAILAIQMSYTASSESGDEKVTWGTAVQTDLADVGGRGTGYPSVIEHDGVVYAAGPSDSKGQGVSIYRCVEFPAKWMKIADVDLKTGAMHPTLLVYDGRVWLFNTRRRTNDKGQHRLSFYSSSSPMGVPEMDIYYAAQPDGPWYPHAKNPVVSDPARSVNGGGVLVTKDGMFRMAMDCRLYYGQRVTAMQISKLTPTEFEEEPDHLSMLSHVQASGRGFNSLGMHVVAMLPIGGSGGRWIGVADGFAAPDMWHASGNNRRGSVTGTMTVDLGSDDL